MVNTTSLIQDKFKKLRINPRFLELDIVLEHLEVENSNMEIFSKSRNMFYCNQKVYELLGKREVQITTLDKSLYIYAGTLKLECKKADNRYTLSINTCSKSYSEIYIKDITSVLEIKKTILASGFPNDLDINHILILMFEYFTINIRYSEHEND